MLDQGNFKEACCELTFADLGVKMSVRAFAIEEGIDRPFEVVVRAATSDASLEWSRVVGRPAAFRIATGLDARPWRIWSGVLRELEQLSDEASGLSLYELTIAPFFWRLTQRRTRRVFQHLSAVGIAKAVLAEWGIEPRLALAIEELPVHEYRVQLDETDFAFVCRQLEEAGVNYWFEQVAPRGEGEAPSQVLVLGELPQRREPRWLTPIAYLGSSEAAGKAPFVRDLRMVDAMRPGRVVLGGHDFRASRDLRVTATAGVKDELEQRHEVFDFAPKEFMAERSSSEGDRLAVTAGERAARVAFERERTLKRSVRFRTNLLDLEPASVFSLDGHPRPELSHPNRLMVSGASLSGEVNGEWTVLVDAVLASEPYRPRLVTPKPRAPGLESAIVVGPASEEIHTDDLGRVRVRFQWSRPMTSLSMEPADGASCWMRVSQSWAGSGYGLVSLPRVGHEVLVGFLESDPDRPVVVGRLFDSTAAPPFPLPQGKTKSVWRSSSTPGGAGYSEIGFEDKAGEEVLFMRAERNLESTVLGDELASIGKNLSTNVRGNERRAVAGDQRVHVNGTLSLEADQNLAIHSTRGMSLRSGEQAGVSLVDGKLVLSNGLASIVLDGPNVRIDTTGNIWLRSERLVAIQAPHVYLDDDVQIDKHDLVPAKVEALPPLPKVSPPPSPGAQGNGQGGKPGALPPGQGKPGGMKEAEFDPYKFYEELLAQAGIKVKLPKNLPIPPEINAQLEHYAKVAHKAGIVKAKLLDPETYRAMKDRLDARIEAEKTRIQKIGSDVQSIFERQRGHLEGVAGSLGERLELERANLAKLNGDLGAIFSGEKGNLIDSAKALYGVYKEQRAHLMQLREDVMAILDTQKAFIEEWKGVAEDVKGLIDDFKSLVENPKDAILDLVLGPDKELGKDVASLAEELGYGDEVSDLLGLEPPGGAGGDVPGSPGALPPSPKLPVGGSGKGIMSDKAHAALGGSLKKPGGKAIDPKAGLALGPMPGLGSAGGKGATIDASKALSKGPLGGLPKSSPSMLGPTRSVGDVTTRSGGNAVARAGGLASGDVAAAVNPRELGFLATPSEGQLMVIPTEAASHLDEALLSARIVDAQMQGASVDSAVSQALEESGYAVYTRGHGDYVGAFQRVDSAVAGA